jgi:hypothetical protein
LGWKLEIPIVFEYQKDREYGILTPPFTCLFALVVKPASLWQMEILIAERNCIPGLKYVRFFQVCAKDAVRGRV